MRFAGLASATPSSSRLIMKPLVAVGQLTSTGDRAQNLRICKDLAIQAKAKGAALLCLPECFSLVGSSWRETVAAGQALEGPIVTEMRALAKEQGLWLSLGGFPEKRPPPLRLNNRLFIKGNNCAGLILNAKIKQRGNCTPVWLI